MELGQKRFAKDLPINPSSYLSPEVLSIMAFLSIELQMSFTTSLFTVVHSLKESLVCYMVLFISLIRVQDLVQACIAITVFQLQGLTLSSRFRDLNSLAILVFPARPDLHVFMQVRSMSHFHVSLTSNISDFHQHGIGSERDIERAYNEDLFKDAGVVCLSFSF